MRTRPALAALAALALAAALQASAIANTSHAGWPPNLHLQQTGDGGGTLRGKPGVHNELLGGNGNDTIYAADKGDVIWGDKNPSGQPSSQRDYLYGGAGNDWIYSSHGYNDIFTGAGSDNVQLVYGYGTVHCNGAGRKTLVVRKLVQNRRFKLIGCNDVKIVPYAA